MNSQPSNPDQPEPPPGHQSGYPPPPYPHPPPYAYPAQHVTRGGISSTGHIVHLVLTVCSLGMWAPIWFLHWLLTRTKKTTTHQ